MPGQGDGKQEAEQGEKEQASCACRTKLAALIGNFEKHLETGRSYLETLKKISERRLEHPTKQQACVPQGRSIPKVKELKELSGTQVARLVPRRLELSLGLEGMPGTLARSPPTAVPAQASHANPAVCAEMRPPLDETGIV